MFLFSINHDKFFNAFLIDTLNFNRPGEFTKKMNDIHTSCRSRKWSHFIYKEQEVQKPIGNGFSRQKINNSFTNPLITGKNN